MPSIPDEAPDALSIPDEAPDEPSIPDEAPGMPSIDSQLQSVTEKPNEKNDPPSQDIPEEAADVMELDEPHNAESCGKDVVSFDPCDNKPAATEVAASAAEADEGGPSRLQLVSLSASVDVAPSLDRQLVLPFPCVSIPPERKASVASPVTPGNPRPEAIEHAQPLEVPCAGLSEDDVEQPSRLSKRRNLARRAAVKAVQYAETVDIDDDPIVVDEEEDEPVITKSRKRRYPKSPPEKEKKVLHPFFKASASSVKEAKDRPKRPRIVRPPSDAWAYSGATVHVNCGTPVLPWSPLPGLRLFPDGMECGSEQSGSDRAVFEYYPSESASQSDPAVSDSAQQIPRDVKRVENASSELWVDKYKQDRRVDVISATATKELVDWLTPWYADNEGEDGADNNSSDDESMCSFIDEPGPCDKERIAIVSGPVGCGKSTIVANAARQLGLTILEINASTCRTGKRIRDIIGEALRTHRVASNPVQRPVLKRGKGNSRSKRSKDGGSGFSPPSAKTLILFEEVDELQEDEKGFWPSLQELAASNDCRRPIICTANFFSSQMQQLFVAPKESVEADFQRLLIQSKEDHILNPVAYKDISFPARSERQATAVLKRVLASEKVNFPGDLLEYLALTYRKDTRRVINLLHLFGLPGLHNLRGSRRSSNSENGSGVRLRGDQIEVCGIGVMASITYTDLIPATFHVGSESYASKNWHASETFENDKEEKWRSCALESWSTSLNIMSSADTILNSADCEARNRCGEVMEDFDELCLDVDLRTSSNIATELGMRAISYSRQYISLSDRSCNFSSLAKEMQAMDATADVTFIPECPNPRRSILSEYIPTLRTVACMESSGSSDKEGSNGEAQERVVRRTRASLKKGGFCALDLGVSTVSQLKRTALRSLL